MSLFTPRECEVARRLLSSGASNKQIASDMNITIRTVRAHLTTLFDVTGMDNRLTCTLYIMCNADLLSEVMGKGQP